MKLLSLVGPPDLDSYDSQAYSGTNMAVSNHTPGDGVLADVDTKAGINGDSVAPNSGCGFPKPGGGSISHWLQGALEDPLFNYRSTSELPSSADIVIIGSGVSIKTTFSDHQKLVTTGLTLVRRPDIRDFDSKAQPGNLAREDSCCT